MNRTWRRVAVALVLTLLPGTIAQSFNVLNPPRRWPGVPHLVTVDARGIPSVNDQSNGVIAALGAAELWYGLVPLVNARSGTAVLDPLNRRSDVVFGDPLGVCTGSCLAATYVTQYTTSLNIPCGDLHFNEILDSDVVFNLSHSWTTAAETDGCSNEYYLEAVMTHEIGHVLGIGHSDDPNAEMYWMLSACHNKPMAWDDVQAAQFLYVCQAPGPGGGCEGRAYSPEGGPPHCN